MGPAAPSLANYQTAASQIYEPQKQADITTARANTAASVSNLEGTKGQIQSDYQQAINDLLSATNANVGKINQLYTMRLGGNFSGLQGNDLGGMFAKASQQQGTIESARANKLAAISTQETNLQNQELAQESAIGSKYRGLEANYANTQYGSALKSYNSNQLQLEKMQQSQSNSDRSYNLQLQKLAQSQIGKSQKEYKVMGKGQSLDANGNVVKGGTSNGYMFTGPNGQPVNMAEFIQGAGKSGQDVLDLLSNGSSYDRNVLQQVQKSAAGKAAIQNEDMNALTAVIKKYDTGNYYGF